MSLQTRIADLATELGTDYKQFRTWLTGTSDGTLVGLATTNKSSVVAAINELQGSIAGASGIDDAATSTTTSWSSSKTQSEIAAEVTALLGGAGPAYDTLQELKVLIDGAEESDLITALTTTVGTKADKSEIYTRTQLGDPETDLVAAYTAAKL